MCRVVARASAWTQAEGGIVNIIAMTDVSACHWGSAGNTMLQAGKPVPRQESPCPGGKLVPRRETLCHGEKACARKSLPKRQKSAEKVEIPRAAGCKSLPKRRKSAEKGRDSQFHRM